MGGPLIINMSWRVFVFSSIVLSQHHEIQRYGKRSEYLTNAAKNMIKSNQATFVHPQQQQPASEDAPAVNWNDLIEFESDNTERSENSDKSLYLKKQYKIILLSH